MSRNEFKKALEAAIDALNTKIDAKIAKGESYAKEAQKHKQLFKQLSAMQ